MTSITILIFFIIANVIMTMFDVLTLPMIVTSILASFWFFIIIYVNKVLAKKEKEYKHNLKFELSFKTIILLLVIVLLSHYKDFYIHHFIAFSLLFCIRDECQNKYYLIENDNDYNKLVILINKLNKNMNSTFRNMIYGFIFLLLYYVINVVIYNWIY